MHNNKELHFDANFNERGEEYLLYNPELDTYTIHYK